MKLHEDLRNVGADLVTKNVLSLNNALSRKEVQSTRQRRRDHVKVGPCSNKSGGGGRKALRVGPPGHWLAPLFIRHKATTGSLKSVCCF